MSSVSVITRSYDGDAPYIKSFIDHYRRVGCDEFHIIVPKGNSFEILAEVLRFYIGVKLYTDYDDDFSFEACRNIALKNVNTSHLLNVDTDEYIDISEIRHLTKYDYVRLNWAIVPFSSFSAQKIPGFVDRQCKYMIRTELCDFLDTHDCQTKTPVKIHESEFYLLHYVCRSFIDLYIRSAIGNYVGHEFLERTQFSSGRCDVRQLPPKFKMAAAYKRIAEASPTRFSAYCVADTKLETALVEAAPNFKMIPVIADAFANYYSRIDVLKLVSKILKSREYKSYGRLPHHILPSLADQSIIDQLDPKSWIRKKKSSKWRLPL